MRFKKIAIILLFLLTLITVFSSCSSTEQSISPSTSPAKNITTSSPDISPINSVPQPSNSISQTTSPTFINPAITITAPASGISKQSVQAPVIIDKNSDGQVVHANLVKFTGSASSSANVMVNSIQAVMSNNGSYYAFLDLKPGENTIDIKTNTGQSISFDQIHVTFNPPLVVDLSWPRGNGNTDYTKNPITINGIVSDPLANVEINQQPVKVNTNGDFSMQTLLKIGYNSFLATASSGLNKVSYGISIQVLNNGMLSSPPPGLGSDFSRAFFNIGNTINVKIGETVIEDVDVQCNKDLLSTSPYNIFSTEIVKNGGTQPSSPQVTNLTVTGLSINFIPSTYKIYPNIEYHSLMEIKADTNVTPGNYNFTIIYSLVYGGFSQKNITISVER